LRERRADIEAAKGLAIALVVFGHLVARQDPAGVQWYEPLRRAVYAFHMPLFLYLSGVVAVYAGFLQRPRAAFWRLAAARAQRLLVPFFGLGVFIVLGKCAAVGLVHVDNAPASVWAGLRALVWDTDHSPALSIWYLFVLFAVSLASVLVLGGQPARLPWLLAGALVVFWVPLPARLYLDRVGTFAPFFLLGAAAGFAGARWDEAVDRIWPWAMAMFGACLLAIVVCGPESACEARVILLLVGTMSLPAIHGLLRCSWFIPFQKAFLLLGRYCFMIYLFNTLFIGLAKGLLLLAWPWDGANFLPFACVLMCAGLMGPIGLKRYAFRRIKFLDRMTD
jgi:fucose 4-O-acetylase-like acetyltransferase